MALLPWQQLGACSLPLHGDHGNHSGAALEKDPPGGEAATTPEMTWMMLTECLI